jgi:hypothetical protein
MQIPGSIETKGLIVQNLLTQMHKTMKTKQFVITAFAVAALITASMSTLLAGNQDNYSSNYRDYKAYYNSADSSDTTDSGGGIIIPPIGN